MSQKQSKSGKMERLESYSDDEGDFRRRRQSCKVPPLGPVSPRGTHLSALIRPQSAGTSPRRMVKQASAGDLKTSPRQMPSRPTTEIRPGDSLHSTYRVPGMKVVLNYKVGDDVVPVEFSGDSLFELFLRAATWSPDKDNEGTITRILEKCGKTDIIDIKSEDYKSELSLKDWGDSDTVNLRMYIIVGARIAADPQFLPAIMKTGNTDLKHYHVFLFGQIMMVHRDWRSRLKSIMANMY